MTRIRTNRQVQLAQRCDEINEVIEENIAIIKTLKTGVMRPAEHQHIQTRIKACNALYNAAKVFLQTAIGEAMLEDRLLKMPKQIDGK